MPDEEYGFVHASWKITSIRSFDHYEVVDQVAFVFSDYYYEWNAGISDFI